MNTLEAQRQRLLQEIATAEAELNEILRFEAPNIAMVNFYQDMLVRNRELVRMIEQHLAAGDNQIQQAQAS